MIAERQLSRIILDSPFFSPKRWARSTEEGTIARDSIGATIFDGNHAESHLEISYPVTKVEGSLRSPGQRHAPILVQLLQFNLPGIEVKEDEYWLGRKPFGEPYGGELWLHRTRITSNRREQGKWEIDFSPGVGDLARYRDVVEHFLGNVPWVNKAVAVDDVLSFIDGMRN